MSAVKIDVVSREKLVSFLYLRTYQKKISWGPYNEGYATYIHSITGGFIKIVVIKHTDSYDLRIWRGNLMLISETYHSLDGLIFTDFNVLYGLLSKKEDDTDAIVNELVAYFDKL